MKRGFEGCRPTEERRWPDGIAGFELLARYGQARQKSDFLPPEVEEVRGMVKTQAVRTNKVRD
jgi:hypothetical protein